MTGNGNPSSPVERGLKKAGVEWTPSGYVFAGLGVSLFLVGMLRVDGVMAAMGLAAGILLILVRLLGARNLDGLELGYRGPRRVEVGKSFDVKLELTNSRRILDGFRLEFGLVLMGETQISGSLGWITAGAIATALRRVSLKTRGLRKEHAGWVESSFPLGLFKFRKLLLVEAEIGVLPASKVPGELRFGGFLLDGLPNGGSRQFGAIGEWQALREWRGGDSVKQIAWAASMRSGHAGGALLVRQDEPPGSQAEACVVVFHSFGADGNLIRPDRFEKALSLLSGVLGCLQGWGISTRLVADFREWESFEIRSKRQLAMIREELMHAVRAGWTEAHDLKEQMGGVGAGECMVVVSDVPEECWKAVVPQMVLKPVLVDIVKHEGFGVRGMRFRKGGAA